MDASQPRMNVVDDQELWTWLSYCTVQYIPHMLWWSLSLDLDLKVWEWALSEFRLTISFGFGVHLFITLAYRSIERDRPRHTEEPSWRTPLCQCHHSFSINLSRWVVGVQSLKEARDVMILNLSALLRKRWLMVIENVFLHNRVEKLERKLWISIDNLRRWCHWGIR